MNISILLGRMVRDPELRFLPNAKETAICRFSVAINDRVGETKKVYFHEVVMFGKVAQTVAQHFKKGSQILITGQLVQDRYVGKDGRNLQKVFVIANRFNFCGNQPAQKNNAAAHTNDRNDVSKTDTREQKSFADQQQDFGNIDDFPVQEDIDADDIPF